MRLALVVPGFSAGESDWAIPALLGLTQSLAHDHDVHVWALRYPHRRHPYRLGRVSVHPLGYGSAGGAQRLSLLLRGIQPIVAEHRRQPFDLIHGLWADEPGFIAVMAGRLLRRPAIVSIMGGELVGFPQIGYGGQLSRLGRYLSAWALPRAAAVTVGSPTLAQLAAAHVPAARLQILPLGIDDARFGPPSPAIAPAPPILAGVPALLHVASLSPIKDQATLLRAFAQVVDHHRTAHLHIVGDGPLRPQLESQARQLGIAAAVTFHGAIAHADLPVYYSAADLFVLSSLFESQSLVVLEAAACGCLPVGTNVGLLPDLIPADLLVPPTDAAALAQAILRGLADARRKQALIEALRRRVREEFSLPHTTRQFLALYERARAAEHGARTPHQR